MQRVVYPARSVVPIKACKCTLVIAVSPAILVGCVVALSLRPEVELQCVGNLRYRDSRLCDFSPQRIGRFVHNKVYAAVSRFGREEGYLVCCSVLRNERTLLHTSEHNDYLRRRTLRVVGRKVERIGNILLHRIQTLGADDSIRCRNRHCYCCERQYRNTVVHHNLTVFGIGVEHLAIYRRAGSHLQRVYAFLEV